MPPQTHAPYTLAKNHLHCLKSIAFVALAFLAAIAGAQDVTTAHNDTLRNGVQANETVLTPANVHTPSFGKLFSFAVVGDVYAQPLYLHQFKMGDGKLHNVLFVATAQDYVYAFDADGKNPAQGYLWRRSLLGAGETWVSSNDVNTTDITPNIGITGTPVIDRTGATLYVVAKSKTTQAAPVFVQRLHALSLIDGTEKLNGPTTIQATVAGSGDGGSTVSFSALLNNQRPALLLAPTPSAANANSVFIGWSSHGDNGAYHGWILSYDSADISRQTGAWTDTPNGSQGGIWMSGGGLSTDGSGDIFAAGGNGTFDANVHGLDFGDSAFKLNLGKSGLIATDSFTPADQLSLDQQDNDMGTSAVTLLPNQTGAVPHLLITTDKTGEVYLLNRDKMGDYTQPNNSSLQSFSLGFPVHSSFAFFNNLAYIAGGGGPLVSWRLNPSSERFAASPASQSSATYGCSDCDGSGTTPSISANGNSNAIVWALDNSAFGSGPALLHAYDAADLTKEYFNSTQAANNRDAAAGAVKFTTPTIANGFVYVGGSGAITVYGERNASAPLAAAPTFAPAAGTYTSPRAVTLASSTADASIYYTVDGSTPSTGSTLYSGPIAVDSAQTIQAVAIAPGFAQSQAALAEYTITVGTSSQGAVPLGFGFPAGSVTLNGSAQLSGTRLRLTDGGSGETASAFYPKKVNVQSFTNDFDFQLANATADGFTFVIQNAGTSAIGTGGGGLGYGSDAGQGGGGATVGSSIAIKFDLYDNNGEGSDSTGLYEDGASPETPAIDLSSTGIDLHSGDPFHVHMLYNGSVLTVQMTDTTTNASATETYTVNIPAVVGATTAYVGFTGASGGLTAVQDVLDWVYAPTPYFPSSIPATGGLHLNGAARLASNKLRLTDGGLNEAASVFFPTRVMVSSFVTDFKFQLTNPAAEGFTFVLGNDGLTAKGSSGAALGYGTTAAKPASGITSSVAIKFDLNNNAGEGSDSTGLYVNGALPTVPATDLTSSGIDLHSGHVFAAHLVYDGTTLTVSLTDTVTNKAATQSYTIDIPRTVGNQYANAGFTAATGTASATQEVLSWTYQ